jgi:two-component system, OmpR family, sensor histidine kinase MtrB
VRIRLIVAFIVVALLAALAANWFNELILPFYALPSWLRGWTSAPPLVVHMLYKHPRGTMPHPDAGAVISYTLAAVALLLAMMTGVAVAASRRVLLPVRRLAQAAQRMSGGDLSVRIKPKGRDELARLTTTFNAMAAALEGKISELQRMEARARQFAGDVSHELRTPLTAMTAVADILPGHPGLTGDGAAAAQLVSQEIRHLNRLVHDLIEISRFDAGTAQLVLDNTGVAAAVAACLRARGWSDVDTDIPAGLTMPLDRRRFDVILANLIGNALCHGRPPVSVQASVQAAGGGERLALLVRDHGPGVPAEALPHVFERFYKADTARSRSEGSGLGLAIACENTRLHGGSIDAANHPGGGALFTLQLPMSRPGPAPLTQPAEEPAAVTRS